MKNILSLTKIQFKNTIFSFLKPREDRKWLAYLGLIAAAGMIVYLILFLTNSLLDIPAFIMKREEIISYYLLFMTFFLLTYNINLILQTFFGKNRAFEQLSTMPLTISQVVLSNTFVFYVMNLWIISLIVLPFIINMVLRDAETHIIITTIFLVLTLPLMIIGFVMIVVGLLMSVFAKLLKTQWFMSVLNILIIFSVYAAQIVFREMAVSEVIGGYNLYMIFPPMKLANNIYYGDLISGVYFSLITLLSIWIAVLLFKIRFKKLCELQVSSSSGKRGKVEYRGSKNVLFHLVKRQIAIILSESSFSVQVFFDSMTPIFISFLMFFIDDSLRMLFIGSEHYILALAAATRFLTSIVSSTSINREGRFFWQNKVLPISTRKNLMSRQITSFLLATLPSGIFVLGFGAFLGIPPVTTVLITVIMMLMDAGLSALDIFINIMVPNITWTQPQRAVKNAVSTLWSLAIRIPVFGIIYYIFTILPDFQTMLYAVGVFAVIVLLSGTMLLMTEGVRSYERIEA